MMERQGKWSTSQRPAPEYITALLVVAFGAATWFLHAPVWASLRSHPYFAVTDLSIRGAGPFLTRDEILAWLGISEQVRIWDLSPARVRARLETHPLIERARVERSFPNRLAISIRERRPAALLLLDDLFYVSRNGQLLRRFDSGENPDFPIVTGLSTQTAPGYRAWAVRRALRLQRLCRRVGCFEGISEIHVDSEGGIVLYPRKPRVQVILGWGSWKKKLRRAERTLRVWEGRTEHLARVDVRFRNQVVVELRERGTKPGQKEGGFKNRTRKS